MKRILGIASICSVVCATLFVLITGCGQPTKKEVSKKVTLWHWMTDRNDALKELAKQYKAETGIEVEVGLFAPPDAYTQKIISSANAKVLPDIFGILDSKERFAKYVKYGYIADLTPTYQADGGAWEKSLFKKAVDASRFSDGNAYDAPPGIYGVPIDVMNIQMVYNKNLLEKAGVTQPPKTFDEFLSVLASLKRVGVPGFVSGWKEAWLIDCFASNYAFNVMGEEKVMKTFKGEVPYTDPDWIKVFSVFKSIADADGFVVGIITMENKEAEKAFASGQAAFSFNGSWGVNVYHEMNPGLKYGTMLPPAVNSELPMRIWGAAGSSFVVNNRSPRKEGAVEFLKWLSAREQQAYLSTETKNLPASRDALTAIPAELSNFASVMDYTTHPTIWELDEKPKVKEAYLNGIKFIILGEKTPEEVAVDVQKAKEKSLARERK